MLNTYPFHVIFRAMNDLCVCYTSYVRSTSETDSAFTSRKKTNGKRFSVGKTIRGIKAAQKL